MEIGKLTVETRTATGKGVARQLRMHGKVPGVCYGAGIDTPLQVTVDPKALKASLDPKKRQNTVLDLTVENDGKAERTLTAMIWDYQIHPIKRLVTHVDFKAIDPNMTLETEVPVILTGKAKGLVNGGQLNIARHEVLVSARPADIPASFTLDVTNLDLGGVLHVSDLKKPESVEFVTPETITIVTCLAPRGLAEEPTAAAAPEAAEEKKPEAKKEGDA